MRCKKMNIKQATMESYVAHIRSIVERMKVVDHRLVETKDSVRRDSYVKINLAYSF